MRSSHHVLDLEGDPREAAPIVAAAVRAGPAARRTASRSAGSVLPTLPSNKMRSAFEAESLGEERVLTLADVLEDVVAFRPQPLEIRWRDGLRARRAFPDVAVVLLDGSVELWECKPRELDARLVEQLRPLALALRRHGVRYRVRTPGWFAAEPRLSNARRLARQGDRPDDAGLRAALGRALAGVPACTFGDLRAAVGAGVAELLGAAARGAFAIGIDGSPIGEGSPVRAAAAGALGGAYLAACA